jgi:hypothetical protein
LYFCLIAGDDPFVDFFAAVLNAGVAVLDAEFDFEDEVLDLAVPPDAERIAAGGIFLRGLPADYAVLYRPQPRVTIPAGQVLAVKNAYEARLRISGTLGRRLTFSFVFLLTFV